MPNASPPSLQMFHQRLLLLGSLMALGASVPLLRTAILTTRQSEDLRAEAESKLVARKFIPTTRGKILDRKARILAQDQPAFDLHVDYDLISGQWAYTQAAKIARRETLNWNELAPIVREKLINDRLPAQQERLSAAWRALGQLASVAPMELEARRSEIVERVSKTASDVWEKRRRERETELNRGREITRERTDEDEVPETISVPLADVARPIREQRMSHVVVSDLPDALALKFPATPKAIEAAGLLPGMRLVDGLARVYPIDRIGVSITKQGFPTPLRTSASTMLELTADGPVDQIVGWMRSSLYAEDLDRRPMFTVDPSTNVRQIDLGGYTQGDSVGHIGIEAAAERELRGLRGSETTQLDTNQRFSVSREPGKDVSITIDANLQARIQALLSPEAGLTIVQPWHGNKALPVGTWLHGAAVVIDVPTGDVLALVSSPNLTGQQIRSGQSEQILKELGIEGPGSALNKAYGKAYAAGSIVKPLIMVAAEAEGVYSTSESIACTGHFYPDKPEMLRCWIYKQNRITHTYQLLHALSGDEALMVSCNIFFFTLGQRLGPERLVDWFGKFGCGTGPDVNHPTLGLGYQFDGTVGSLAPRQPTAGNPSRRRGITQSESILVGIGQGPIAWTPLHAADAYATLARGGVRIVPRILMDEVPSRQDLGLDQGAVSLALRGLRRAVADERGTGHHISFTAFDGVTTKEPTFNVPGAVVWGKSGTADSGQRSDDNPDASLDHSWFVVLTGTDENQPKYAIAVMIENGGSGGKVAGPVTNQIIWALRDEGYMR